MFCRNCGSEVKPGSKFCANCGASVLVNTTQVQKKSPSKVIIALVIVIVCVLAFLAIGILGFLIDDSGSKEEDKESVTSKVESTTVAETETTIEDKWKDTLSRVKARNAYNGVLICLQYTYTLPGDEQVENYNDIGENKWTVTDIDQDGREELIIQIDCTSMAGMRFAVYDYDEYSEKVVKQIECFPSVEFYDNGVLIVQDSHNHSLGAELWPYSLYIYNKDTDKYEWKASVTSWEKETYPENYDGEKFPDDKDTDGDGILYYISENQSEEGQIKTLKEYEEWQDSYLNGANTMSYDLEKLGDGEFEEYGTDYINTFIDYQKEKGNQAEGLDIGILYAQGGSLDQIARECKNYNMSIKKEEMGYTGKYNGKDTILMNLNNGGIIEYNDTAVPDVSILGIYPGMNEEKARERLEGYGFHLDDGYYITGEGWNNFMAGLTCENGKVSGISIHCYTGYTG